MFCNVSDEDVQSLLKKRNCLVDSNSLSTKNVITRYMFHVEKNIYLLPYHV